MPPDSLPAAATGNKPTQDGPAIGEPLCPNCRSSNIDYDDDLQIATCSKCGTSAGHVGYVCWPRHGCEDVPQDFNPDL